MIHNNDHDGMIHDDHDGMIHDDHDGMMRRLYYAGRVMLPCELPASPGTLMFVVSPSQSPSFHPS